MSEVRTEGTARADGRAIDALRPASFERDFTVFAPGSVLVTMGLTRVLCTASVEERVPPWMRGSGKGWVTAEYSLLPGSTAERVTREAARGRQSGRTQEIQRLIGRSLRSVCDMVALGEVQITVDCDVLQADGGPARPPSAAPTSPSMTPSPASCRRGPCVPTPSPRRWPRCRSASWTACACWTSPTPRTAGPRWT